VKIHIVQKGDTLWKIAKKYGVNFEELKKLNSQLSNPDMIMPGMKIKVPTSGGTIKKETSHNPGPGVKKEIPLEHPFAKEKPIKEVPVKEVPVKEIPVKEMPVKEIPKKEIPIKEVPIKEVPKKEQPILKETPKAPYTPKMPLQVVPEIDINNYYMMNMQNMKIEQPQLPPKPANILPDVKEVPKKEIPIPAPPPVQEIPCQPQEYCVPVTPILPGPGFCPPYGGFTPTPAPTMPYMPHSGYLDPGVPMSTDPVYGVPPGAVGPAYVPGHYDMESSSFMPQVPVVNPAYNPGYPGGGVPGGVMGAPGQTSAYSAPPGYSQIPASYPGGYEQLPPSYQTGYPAGYAPMPQGYPAGYEPMTQSYPAGYHGGYVPGTPAGQYTAQGYAQIPYGYPPLRENGEFDMRETAAAEANTPIQITQHYNQEQGLPVGTGSMADCGCGDPAPGAVPAGTQPNFVPPTPPIYSAPYTGSAAQPPFMNPYGMGPVGTAYGMPGYPDESS